mgnify:CR=1 FL=1
MSKYGFTLTVALTAQQSACFEEMAKSAGFMWGRAGNISGFLRAVADGYFVIIPSDKIPNDGLQDCSIESESEV